MRRKILVGVCMVLFGIMVVENLEAGPLRGKLREKIKEFLGLKGDEEEKTTSSTYPVIEETYSSYTQSNYGPGDYRRYVQSGGKKRFYELHVPSQYNKQKPIPVVLNFHGAMGWPMIQRNNTGMDKISDDNGFIVVYPAGTGKFPEKLLTWNGGIGCGSAKEQNIDDVGFTRALISDLGTLFNIDSKRIYAAGFSNGGFMTYRLGCELSDKLAAIAVVSGVYGEETSKIKPSRPVPVIHFHGKKDETVPYDGGFGAKDPEHVSRPSVKDTIQAWINFDKCPTTPAETFRKGAAVRERYGPGKGGSEVILWTLEDGGHTWPSGKSTMPEDKVGKINTDISASELIWEFFKKHPMP